MHRDIKPANLMLSRTGEVRLLDLGLSKIRAEGQDQLRFGTEWSANSGRNDTGHRRLHGD